MSQEFGKESYYLKPKTTSIKANIITTPPSKIEIIPAKTKKTTRIIRPIPDHTKESKTPIYDKILAQHQKLSKESKFKCEFDYTAYKKLEKRFQDSPPRGGIIYGGNLKLINHHYTCQECLYALMIDTYGRGCVHNCSYCYAKSELVVHGYWNKPFPMPIDITSVWKMFYTVFETDRKSKWRSFLEKRIPIRIGHASDSFMWLDQKYKVTQELIKILNFYKYPYIIATRSDLIAHDTYIDLMDKDLCSVQMSIISTNEEVNKKIEPGAPSAQRRLNALRKLNQAGFWTTVRLNPLFPVHPDGYFTDPNFPKEKRSLKLDIFQWDMIEEIASYQVPSLLAGFGRFSSYAINQMDPALGIDFKQFYDGKKFKGTRDFHFSDEEVRYYYKRIKDLCKKFGVQFTTCYIGNGEAHFWRDQDLWDNKHDCCNVKNRVKNFKTDAHIIPYGDRLKFSTSTCAAQQVPQRELINIRTYVERPSANPFLTKTDLAKIDQNQKELAHEKERVLYRNKHTVSDISNDT